MCKRRLFWRHCSDNGAAHGRKSALCSGAVVVKSAKDGGNVRRVVTQEGSPSLAGWPPLFDHVLGDARLRDFKPELEQFAVNAWRAPKRILHAHLPDQSAQLRGDLRSPSQWARLQTPVAAKAGPMPTNQRLGTDDREDLQDRWKPAI